MNIILSSVTRTCFQSAFPCLCGTLKPFRFHSPQVPFVRSIFPPRRVQRNLPWDLSNRILPSRNILYSRSKGTHEDQGGWYISQKFVLLSILPARFLYGSHESIHESRFIVSGRREASFLSLLSASGCRMFRRKVLLERKSQSEIPRRVPAGKTKRRRWNEKERERERNVRAKSIQGRGGERGNLL